MDNCWISCQVMADMEKFYDDLMIMNLYKTLKFFNLPSKRTWVIIERCINEIWWENFLLFENTIFSAECIVESSSPFTYYDNAMLHNLLALVLFSLELLTITDCSVMLGTIPILRQHIFWLFLTHPPTMSA